MTLSRGDIVLVPFPFTDLTSVKVRPAIIISPNHQKEDLIIAFISSVVPGKAGSAELLLTETSPDFPVTGLKRASVFKMDKLLTLSRALIQRRLGHAPAPLQDKLDRLLETALGLK